jgi:GDPmannose 4,6-dehydratase
MPEYVMQVNGVCLLNMLEAAKEINPSMRIYQASTSELFGKAVFCPQNEQTPFHPRSPYGIAKLQAFWTIVNYREAYEMYACNGILFNHESPRRGEEFVSRKISLGVNRIVKGLEEKIFLGNLDAQRDWGYAKEFVFGMWQMLQQEKPQDFVLATGKTHTVRNFVEKAFSEVGIALAWHGKGLEEKGIDTKTGNVVVEIDARFFRPAEVDVLLGDASKAKKELGWEAKTTFSELVSLMVQSDKEMFS